MGVDFYYMSPSAPCRSVWMVAKYLDIPLNLCPTDLMKGETKTPEFLKINPAHCVPTIVDDGFSLWESRPILEYLAEKYGNGKLIPSDIKGKSTMRKFLSIDATGIFKAIGDYLYPQVFEKVQPPAEKKEKLDDVLKLADKLLVGPYFLGNALTLADFAILASVTTLEALDYDFTAFPRLTEWVDRLKEEFTFYKEANGDGVEIMRKFVKGEFGTK